VVDARLAVVAVRLTDLRAVVAVPFAPDFAARAVLRTPRVAERRTRLAPAVGPDLRARLAAVAVLFAALVAVRVVVVDARFAVVAVRFIDLRAVVPVPFAPDFATRPVVVADRALRWADRALRWADRALRWADERDLRAPARTRFVVASPVRFASLTVSIAASVADVARDRTPTAVRRAAREPEGVTRGFFLRRTSATRSLTAVTLP
jgi:hypothetical protein